MDLILPRPTDNGGAAGSVRDSVWARPPAGGTMTDVRLADFWERMDLTFGPAYARSWADDQVLAALGGRTVSQALEQGEETRTVWDAVCAHAEVPAQLR